MDVKYVLFVKDVKISALEAMKDVMKIVIIAN